MPQEEHDDLTAVGEAAEAVLPPDPPIKIAPSPTFPVLGVMLRQLALIVGAASALMSLFSTKDIAGMITYMRGEDFIVAVLAAAGLASMLWGWFREMKIWKKLVTMEKFVPDSIAYIKNKILSLGG